MRKEFAHFALQYLRQVTAKDKKMPWLRTGVISCAPGKPYPMSKWSEAARYFVKEGIFEEQTSQELRSRGRPSTKKTYRLKDTKKAIRQLFIILHKHKLLGDALKAKNNPVLQLKNANKMLAYFLFRLSVDITEDKDSKEVQIEKASQAIIDVAHSEHDKAKDAEDLVDYAVEYGLDIAKEVPDLFFDVAVTETDVILQNLQFFRKLYPKADESKLNALAILSAIATDSNAKKLAKLDVLSPAFIFTVPMCGAMLRIHSGVISPSKKDAATRTQISMDSLPINYLLGYTTGAEFKRNKSEVTNYGN